MKKVYCIKKAANISKTFEDNWKSVQKLGINCYPWNENNYTPKVEAGVLYTEDGFHIMFRAFEDRISVKYFNMNDPVYRDSCVEFFFNPKPESNKGYLNFELNAAGAMLLGFGESRHDRHLVTGISPGIFCISGSVGRGSIQEYSGPFWDIQYFIPFDFIEKYFGKLDIKSGYQFEGNFYKCGDETEYPHFACWNPIVNNMPDFHMPEFFGSLVLE